MRDDRLFYEMVKAIPMPRMVTEDIYPVEFDEDINRHLCTKQVIHLSEETVKNIIETNDVKIPDALRPFVDKKYPEKDESLCNVEDGYGLSEFFGKYNRFIPDSRYFTHVVTHKTDAVLNVYNGITADTGVPEIQDIIQPVDISEINIGKLPFDKVERAKFTRIMEPGMSVGFDVDKDKMYHSNIRIESYMFGFPTMSCNIPYNIYSKIEIPENIYTWDIDQNKYSIAGLSEDKFIEYFRYICTRGFERPFYMQIRQGKIISMSNIEYIALLVAKWLKLPTIPAVLYMLHNCGHNNYALLSSRPIDVITRDIPDLKPDQETLELANRLCNPTFVFTDARHMYTTGLRTDTSKKYRQIFKYDSEEGKAADAFMVIDDSEEDDNKYSEEPLESVQQRLKCDITSQIDDDVAQALKKLIGE